MATAIEQIKERIKNATHKEQSLVVEILSLMSQVPAEGRDAIVSHLDQVIGVAKDESVRYKSDHFKQVRAATAR